MLPRGSTSRIGRKQPPLVGMVGSVSTRIAKQAAASEPDGTQLNGPRTCALDPVRSQIISPSAIVTATSMRMRVSRSSPSLSMKST